MNRLVLESITAFYDITCNLHSFSFSLKIQVQLIESQIHLIMRIKTTAIYSDNNDNKNDT